MLEEHSALQDDVSHLYFLLSDIIRKREGEDIFYIIATIRDSARQYRETGNEELFEGIEKLLKSLTLEQATIATRAFTCYLTLANIAEQYHKVRRQKYHQRNPKEIPRAGSLEETFTSLLTSGISPEKIYQAIISQRVELVLTAHPTEVMRRSLLLKYAQIASLLEKRDRTDLTVREREDLTRDIKCEIHAIWRTDEIRRKKPTPSDEAFGGLLVFEQTLWDEVPAFLRELNLMLRKYTGKDLPLEASPVVFGSWMGGDRDGNPNVTSTITVRVVWLAQWMAAVQYEKELEKLKFELSMTECDSMLRQLVPGEHEPYRAYLRGILKKMSGTKERLEKLLTSGKENATEYYRSSAELYTALKICYNSLVTCGDELIANGRLLDILRRVSCFGLTLVKLDIRQESGRHSALMSEITEYLSLGNYSGWDEDKKIEFLRREISSPRPLIPPDFTGSDDVFELLSLFRTLSAIRTESLGAYVISMAKSAGDILLVYLLQKTGGRKKPLRVVPLFETIDDLVHAPEILTRLFSMPEYLNMIAHRQEVMIGYSDSSKDSGITKAAWELYVCQEKIIQAGRKFHVEVVLFHGRGGTIGRGGGPTYRAILSQPPGSVFGKLRVTEQGEMIQAKFGLAGIAFRTLELYTTSVLRAHLQPPPNPPPEWCEIMQKMADISAQTYKSIVYENPDFIQYFRLATPERELGNLNIGSRPAKRREGGIESLRAIPWIFAWTQTRILLPSWLGVGEAIRQAIDQGWVSHLKQMYRGWYFFRSTIDLIEMVLVKTDLKIAEHYDKNLVSEKYLYIGEEIRRRLSQTRECILQVTEQDKLIAQNTSLQVSIAFRTPWLDPLHILQTELLRRLRDDQNNENLRKAMLLSINGISAGMRNTG